MARIRTIKPEFFTSESVCSVSPLARLLFVGLWCEADREGRLKWKPKSLKIRYLPTDNCKIESLHQELQDEKMIVVYTVDDEDFCVIPGFKTHQVVNNREKESELPPLSDASSRVKVACTRDKAEGRKEGKERKGTGRFTPPSLEEVIQFCSERNNSIEPQKFLDHYEANGWMRGKTKIKDWKACIRTWEGNTAPGQPAPAPSKPFVSLLDVSRNQ